METLKTRKNKFLVMLIIFMLLFSNFGYTIAAIATSDEFEIINKGFFQKDEIKFKTYFEDENGKQINNITQNVNGKVKLVVEVLPQVEGYLKNAELRAVAADGDDINFKFTSVTENLLKDANSFLNNALVKEEPVEEEKPVNEVEEDNNLSNALVPEESETEPVEEPNEMNTVENNTTETNTVETNTVSGENNELFDALVGGETNNESLNPLATATSPIGENNTSENDEGESNPLADALSTSEEANVIGLDSTNPSNEEVENQTEEDRLVDEDAIIEEETEKSRIDEEIRNAILDIKVVSENEISLSNIIGDTKFEIELEYKQGETFNVADLYKNIKLQLGGTYINRNLEEVPIGKENEITVGWEYTKDITLESEYTKFSPFELEDIKGTIVENKITVTRNIEDEKYLPVKSTRLEIVAPQVNGKKPIAADVIANKLLATKGEDYGYVTFEDKNWKYDQANGTINVFVENENNRYSSGSDEYVIIYRYEDYIDGENSNLSKNVKATVTEYSGTENNTIIKEIKDSQDIKVDVDELVTYSIGSDEGEINKAKIYANYNSEEPLYETIFTNQVNVNILTSDVLQQLKVDCSKEVYKDANGVEFEAQGIEYKQIKFNYAEINSLLSDGGEIVITTTADETLYVLNKDAITKEEDCTISLNGVNGIYVYVNNIAKNGTLNFELTKAIKKCNYPKSIFKSIAQIESRVSAEVKYSNIEDRFALQTVAASKEFEESQTSATLSINRETLSTLRQNENVELKIELNNDKETSDLYVNPSFEIVFPKYVTSVGIESINLLNDCGLRVGDFETYTENDIVKMRIDLTGTQTMFSENTITNGTNIIVNANIQVDEYTPARQDQIKLYYCNEGVATYQAQTKWSIRKNIPNGILKETNGFDIETIKYQAPTGLIAINGIVNYDGNLSEVRSVKQGPVSKEIPINSPSRIATMELLALNNTENVCSDVVLMGRIPLKGVKDVITNEDLGTTTDVRMVDKIKEDVQNGNTTEIYYSANENANKDLQNSSNGWTTEVADLSMVRSYMIVIKGDVEAGSVLRFTYDFEIPENLPYEAKIAGSFGAYYNNIKVESVVYETSSADYVILETGKGPKLEATMSVDIGDGTEVLSNRRIKYTVTVVNQGSEIANDVEVNCKIPQYTQYIKQTSRPELGDYGYVIEAKKDLSFKIGTVNPGESKNVSYDVITSNKPTLSEYALKDENGYYIIEGYEYEEVPAENDEHTTDHEHSEGNKVIVKPIKKYITEMPSVYIVNKATVKTSLLANEIETNEIKNELNQSNFKSEIRIDFDRHITSDMATNFTLLLTNTSRRTLKNVVAVFNASDLYDYRSSSIDEKEGDVRFDETERKLYFNIGDMEESQRVVLTVSLMSRAIENEIKTEDCYFEYYAENIETEKSTVIPQTVVKPILEVKDATINFPEKINENDLITITTEIKNKSELGLINGSLKFAGVDNFDVIQVRPSNGGSLSITGENGMFSATLPKILGKETITVDIILRAKNLPGTEDSSSTITRLVCNKDQDDIVLDPISIVIRNTEKTYSETEEERVKELEEERRKAEEEAARKEAEENAKKNTENGQQENTQKNNTNTNSNNNNSSNNAGQNTNNAKPNNNNQAPSSETSKPTYTIEGMSWLDLNKNGSREDEETGINGIKVYLLTSNNNMLQSTVTNKEGKYKFDGIENGKYLIAVSYDNNEYTATTYKKANIPEERNSSIIENVSGEISAVTNEIVVENGNISNINIGLQNKDIFDLLVNKYISKITVETKGNTEVYEYDNLEVAKVEIHSKKINGAKVNLEYTVSVENVGNIEGYAEQLVDYIDKDIEFDENQNKDWFKGSDGYIYIKDLNQTLLKSGEKKEFKLNLSKTMNQDNTGVYSNKIALLKSYNQYDEKEQSNNNTSVQNTFILISTGYTAQILGAIGIIAIIIFVVYLNREKITSIDFSKFIIYKNKNKKKIKIKKNYK